MNDAVVAKALSIRLGGRAVVDDVSLDVAFGSVLGLLGPNGAGKSTLLRGLMGLVPFQGSVRLMGSEPSALSPRERAQLVAYVPQRSELVSALSVEAVVSQGRYAHRAGKGGRMSARDREAVAEAMRVTDTDGLAGRPFVALSQGEKQRVLLARALATEARVILLDEPTSSLDIGHALRFFELLERLRASGHALVLVLHHLGDALEFTQRALLLNRGRPVSYGRTADVLAPEHLRRVYGVAMDPHGAPRFQLNRSLAERPKVS